VLVAGGAEARRCIVRYAQLKLQGPDAYTADELATLDARRCRSPSSRHTTELSAFVAARYVFARTHV
jgi:hypothetical protein